jgi:hypothetical protein
MHERGEDRCQPLCRPQTINKQQKENNVDNNSGWERKKSATENTRALLRLERMKRMKRKTGLRLAKIGRDEILFIVDLHAPTPWTASNKRHPPWQQHTDWDLDWVTRPIRSSVEIISDGPGARQSIDATVSDYYVPFSLCHSCLTFVSSASLPLSLSLSLSLAFATNLLYRTHSRLLCWSLALELAVALQPLIDSDRMLHW